MTDEQPAVSAETRLGAVVVPTYVKRDVTVYGIQEHEADALSTLNTQATIFYSIASGLVSLGAGIFTNAIFATEMSAEAKLAVHLAAPVFVILAVLFIALGFNAGRSREATWARIKEQSKLST